jgi:predicted negative regulator of RcsB-dependent stress response
MTDKKHTTPDAETKETVDTVTGFWNQNSKRILIGLVAVIVIIGGYLGYKYLVSEPNEQKAAESMFAAEQYFRSDSIRLALEGDAANLGFLRVISKYGGTKSGNLAHFYAGSCYLKLGDFANAAKQLEQFSTSEPLMKARGKCLLADAYSESNKKEEAAKLYKEAGTTLADDEVNSPDYLFRAGYLYESLGKNQEAIEVYKLIKTKYPRYPGADIDKYLGRLGYTE